MTTHRPSSALGSITVTVPNKHIPVCPTGPASIDDSFSPPPSPREENERTQSSLLYPPDRYTRLDSGDLSMYKIDADEVAAALDYSSRQPLPDPSQVFPWFHGLHPSNHMQQTFFVARRRALKRTPCCLRGVALIKADGDMTAAVLKGSLAPDELLQTGSDGGGFLEVDPKEGFSVRNFQIQAAKAAMTSDIIVYGDDAVEVRKLGWNVASAQQRWRERHAAQGHNLPEYNTFICTSSFTDFEARHPEIVAIDSGSRVTGNVIDFFHQERREMYAMTKSSEISHNVWMGPTPEMGSEEELAFDILIECTDMGRLRPQALQAIAENPNEYQRYPFLDFPASGSMLVSSWSHAEPDAIIDTCKWIYHLAHGTRPEPDCSDSVTDFDVDSSISEQGFDMVEHEEGHAGEGMDVDADSAQPSSSESAVVRRPRKILIHCADGYTESTLLGIAYFAYSTGRPLPEAWLALHTERKRNFFAYPTDVQVLVSLATRLLYESPAFGASIRDRAAGKDRSLAEVAAMIHNEPRWLRGLDGSFPSRILDYMYLGNLGHANNPDLLRALGIGRILSVGETATWQPGELEAWGPENVCVVQGVQDNGIDPLTEEFERCLEFIGGCSLICVPVDMTTFKLTPGPTRSRTPAGNGDACALPRGRLAQRDHLHRRGDAVAGHVVSACVLLRTGPSPQRHHPATPPVRLRAAQVGRDAADAA